MFPDAIRALTAGEPLWIRNPRSIRPWQHVLEPLSGYLLLAERLYSARGQWEGGWNFGPAEEDAQPVSSVASQIVKSWGSGEWRTVPNASGPHEEALLKLDSAKARYHLGWKPRLRLAEAIAWAVEWYRRALDPAAGMAEFTVSQIHAYEHADGSDTR